MIDTYDRFQLYEDAGLGAEEYGEIRRTCATEKTPVRSAKEHHRGLQHQSPEGE